MFSEHTYIPEILDCIKKRLDFMVLLHCKTLFVRFDVRFASGTIHNGPSTEISDLMRALAGFYRQQEHPIRMHYIWVREHNGSDAPHYHVILLLNGSLVQNPMGVWAKASEFWSWITNGPAALVHLCGGMMIRRPSTMVVGEGRIVQQNAFQSAYTDALNWGSYLAKEFSKGNAPYRMRQYGSSRLWPMTPDQLNRLKDFVYP